MSMPMCYYHGDENLSIQEESSMYQTICDIKLYDLMGEDHSVWIRRNSRFGFDLHVANDEDLDVVIEKGIHPFAIESLATFCRRFLHGYSRLMDEELA